jgi:hypothetical protein
MSFIALFIIIFLVIFRYSYAYFRVPENFRHVVETGKAVDELTERDALVIASIENGPDLVYYCNRKGWFFRIDMEEKRKEDIVERKYDPNRSYDPIAILEQLREEGGASCFASASKENEFLRNERFSRYMFENYKVIKETPYFIIFDIKTKIKQGGAR